MTAIHRAEGGQFEKTHEDGEGRGTEVRQSKKVNPPTEHSIARTHPETGRKALYVNSIFTQRIRGVAGKESRAVLGYLYDHIATLEFTCHFYWDKHSVAFWDNLCTQHYAIANYGGAHQLMHRVMMNGDMPIQMTRQTIDIDSDFYKSLPFAPDVKVSGSMLYTAGLTARDQACTSLTKW